MLLVALGLLINLVPLVDALAGPAAGGDTKRILVTGANKGIGRAICERLLSNYDDVEVLLGSRDMGRGEKAVGEIKASISNCGERIRPVQIDTSDEESVNKCAENIAAMGPLYGIVNNAGVINEGYDGTLQVNYFGEFFTS